jgi:hypothetical protein
VTWWAWLVWAVVLAALNAVGHPWLAGRLVRRGLRAGRATVSARGTTPGFGEWPPQWRLHRVSREAEGRLVLQRSTDHPTAPVVVLLSPAGSGRAVPGPERRRVVTGARRAVPVRTSAGVVEVAARPEVLDWLLAELPD